MAKQEEKSDIGWVPSEFREATLLVAAGLIGLGWFIYAVALPGNDNLTNLTVFWSLLHGDQVILPTTWATPGYAVKYVVWIVLALVALLCVGVASGRRAAGVAWVSPAHQVRLLGAWMFTIPAAVTVVGAACVVPLVLLLDGRGVAQAIIPTGINPPYIVLRSVFAGITEEIFVTAVAWRLLERIPVRPGRDPFVMTGTATAILVSLRTSYHLYQGLWVISIAVVGWLVVRFYRNTRALWPLVVGHAAWDIAVSLLPARYAIHPLMVLGIVFVWVLTAGPGMLAPFGVCFRWKPLGRIEVPSFYLCHDRYTEATWRTYAATRAWTSKVTSLVYGHRFKGAQPLASTDSLTGAAGQGSPKDAAESTQTEE